VPDLGLQFRKVFLGTSVGNSIAYREAGIINFALNPARFFAPDFPVLFGNPNIAMKGLAEHATFV